MLLIGNKTDLGEARQIGVGEAQALATNHGLQYMETTARESGQVGEALQQLTQQVVQKLRSGMLTPGDPGVSLGPRQGAQGSKPFINLDEPGLNVTFVFFWKWVTDLSYKLWLWAVDLREKLQKAWPWTRGC